jgi:hypothetical protein
MARNFTAKPVIVLTEFYFQRANDRMLVSRGLASHVSAKQRPSCHTIEFMS